MPFGRYLSELAINRHFHLAAEHTSIANMQLGEKFNMQQAVDATTKNTRTAEDDFLPIHGTDHVEFYVGNAKQAAYFYRLSMGFSLVAYRGPETGTRDRVSYVLAQNKIRFVLTTPLLPSGEIADHVYRHGDGVKSIALWVDDAQSAWQETTARGARSVQPAFDLEDGSGSARLSSIAI